MRLTTLLLTSTIAASVLVTSASAEQRWQKRGVYVSGGGGVAFDLDIRDVDSPIGALIGDIDLEVGLYGTGALGFSFGNGFRVEGAATYSIMSVGTISTTIGDLGVGTVSSAEFMLNGFYDFRQGQRIQPYVGLGIGASQVSLNDVNFLIAGGGPLTLDGSDWSPAAQAIVGVGAWVSDGFFVALEYRYVQSLEDTKYLLSDGSPIANEFSNHRIGLLGRYQF